MSLPSLLQRPHTPRVVVTSLAVTRERRALIDADRLLSMRGILKTVSRVLSFLELPSYMARSQTN
jgi:hypothetical protein